MKYGKTGKRENVVPSFIGYDSFYVDNWCLNNGITCYFNKVESDEEKNQILTQSRSGELLENVTTIYFDVSKGKTEIIPPKPVEPKKEEEPKKEVEPEPEPEQPEEPTPEEPTPEEPPAEDEGEENNEDQST